ncbi:GTP 3',8-cyclase MoaA [Bacillus lacus]|uniref:GTP 3',8-cyclase n=1 Tax=Metabacillus lacus TaxID=1983721 RepID=A0A7X2IYG5_9BACI|nr:GTP 3',8-cyclase MoaA [Metabacillus lacus]MRX71996.1 GTP 3',8-cyclase MoaA [Metabacillus lacus]
MGVIDTLNRPLRNLRISVTDRCNLRCTYCMPAEIFGPNYKFLETDKLLSFEEIGTLAASFSHLGVNKIRLTGGEPLLRRNLPQLLSILAEIPGITDIALTTNGILLPKLAEELKRSGLNRVNISLDSLDEETFRRMNGRNVSPEAVLKGINSAREAGLGVKINSVVKKGSNEHQVRALAEYFFHMGITVRFIEFMDVGSTNNWQAESVSVMEEMLKQISSWKDIEPIKGEFGEVAKRYRYTGTDREVGFISSISESFCSSCTRARISAEGKLYTCLFTDSGHDLKELLKQGYTELQLSDRLAELWKVRDDKYSEERMNRKQKRNKVEMSYIGG